MKKLLLTAALALSCASGYAQMVQTSALIVTKKALEPVKRGYQSDIRLGVYCLGFHDQTTIEATYAGGYRFGNALFIGAGVGVNYNTWSGQYIETDGYGTGIGKNQFSIPSAKVTVPVFAQIRVYFLKKRVSPFIDATGGAMIAGKGEVVYGERLDMAAKYGRTMGYGTLSLGFNYRMTSKSSMYLLVGGRMHGVRVMQADESFNPFTITPTNKPSSLNIGTRMGGGMYAAIGFTF